MIEFWAALGLACVNRDYREELDERCVRFEPPKPYGALNDFKRFIRSNGLRLSRWEIKELERLLKKDVQDHMYAILDGFAATNYDLQIPRDEDGQVVFSFVTQQDLELCAVIGLACNDGRFAGIVFGSAANNGKEIDDRIRECDSLYFDLDDARYELLANLSQFDGVYQCMQSIEHAGWSPPSQGSASNSILNNTNCASGAVDGRYLHIHQPEMEGFMATQSEGWKMFQALMSTGFIT